MTKITERALVQRINRILAKRDERLARARATGNFLGEWFVIDFRNDRIRYRDANLEDLGRELGALEAEEYLSPARGG